MKKYWLALSLSAVVTLSAEQKPQENWLKDQNDQTDTLAIPLDSSEEEEAVEEKELQCIQKKKPAPADRK